MKSIQRELLKTHQILSDLQLDKMNSKKDSKKRLRTYCMNKSLNGSHKMWRTKKNQLIVKHVVHFFDSIENFGGPRFE